MLLNCNLKGKHYCLNQTIDRIEILAVHAAAKQKISAQKFVNRELISNENETTLLLPTTQIDKSIQQAPNMYKTASRYLNLTVFERIV